jgi:hypothetical protein
MRKTQCLLAACFATGASELSVQPVEGARPQCFPSGELYFRTAVKPLIKLNARGWSSHALATNVVDILLREKLGHEVQVVTLGANETTDNSCAAPAPLLSAHPTTTHAPAPAALQVPCGCGWSGHI